MKLFKILLISYLLFFCGCADYIKSDEIHGRKPLYDYDKNKLVVMSFNVLHSDFKAGWNRNDRGLRVIDIIHNYNADIVCLQETYNFQYKDIKNSFLYYNSYGVGRDNGAEKGESCPIFYRKDRFILLDYGTFWFSSSPHKPGSRVLIDIVPRICTWVKLEENKSNKIIYVYNVHLTPISSESRRKNILLLKEKMEVPFILAGDFNMSIDDKNLNPIKSFNHTHFEHKQIDHIFSSQDIKIKDFFLDKYKYYPSDHFALIAVFDF